MNSANNDALRRLLEAKNSVPCFYYAIHPTSEYIRLILESEDLIKSLVTDLDNHKYFRLESLTLNEYTDLMQHWPVICHYGSEPVPVRDIIMSFCHYLRSSYPEFYDDAGMVLYNLRNNAAL